VQYFAATFYALVDLETKPREMRGAMGDRTLAFSLFE
jgi:hypothetical protein